MYQYMKTNKMEADKELTPAQLYSRFVDRCMTNFHMIFKMPKEKNFFNCLIRIYPEFLNKSVLCYSEEWPDDALQKSAEIIFEDLPVTREQRKIIISSAKEFYFFSKQKIKEMQSTLGHRIEISPSSFMNFVKFFYQLYQRKLNDVTQMKKSYEGAIAKYETIQMEIDTLEGDLEDLKNQSEQLNEEFQILEKKSCTENTKLKELTESMKEEEGKVLIEQGNLDEIKEDVDKEFREVLKKIDDCVTVLKQFETSDFQQPLSIKKPSNGLKKTIGAVALLLGKEPNMIPDPSSKKKDAELVPDYWGPGKKMLTDIELMKKISEFDQTSIPCGALETLKHNFTSDSMLH